MTIYSCTLKVTGWQRILFSGKYTDNRQCPYWSGKSINKVSYYTDKSLEWGIKCNFALTWDVRAFLTCGYIVSTSKFFPNVALQQVLTYTHNFSFWHLVLNCLVEKISMKTMMSCQILHNVNIGYVKLNLAWFMHWKSWNYTSQKEYW